MRRAVKFKNIVAFAVVLIVLISVTVIPAYADFPPLSTAGRRLGSWILSGLTALNIAVSSTVSTSRGADIANFLADPLDVTYSYTEMWEDKPTIQIWDDYTTIDGVTYTDIWLSNEAAQKFKTDGMDFATAYSIASNTNGTFAEGVGYSGNNLLFDVNGVIRTQDVSITSDGTYQIADCGLRSEYYPSFREYRMQTDPLMGGTWNGPGGWISQNYPWNAYIQYTGPQGGYLNLNGSSYSISSRYTQSPFDFDWIAGTIDPTPLSPDEGIMIRVPSDTPGLQTFITNNYYLTEPTEIDVNLDPDIQGKLDDLVDIILPVLINLDSHDVTFTENHVAPQPQPDVPIVDATVPQVVNPIINEITNYGDQITQQIPQIIETIPTIDDICNNIDTAPYHDIDTGLDKLPTVFLPFITDLRSALGIWHYVTEWLGMIGTSFAFVTGCLTGTAIMTPIYAAIAGYMCIKVYRRMTG